MRHDLFGPLHKGLRHFALSTLIRLGQADVVDLGDLREALDQLRVLLVMRTRHLELEEEVIVAALDARVPGWMEGALDPEHERQRRGLRRLSAEVEALACSSESTDVRRSRSRDLYLHLAHRIGEDFEHMEVEETAVNELLWKHFDDRELRALHGALLERQSPEHLADRVRWTLPALTHDERIELVLAAQSAIPPVRFRDLMSLVRASLPPRDLDRLVESLHRRAS
jgi:hypothetical protein